MSIFKRLFSNKDNRSTPQQSSPAEAVLIPSKDLSPAPVTLRMLKNLVPIRNLAEEELEAWSGNLKSEVYGRQSILFQLGSNDDNVLYLLEGDVEITTADQNSYVVSADSVHARFPLSNGKHHTTRAQALTDVRVLRVSVKIMSTRRMDGYRPVNGNDSIKIPESLEGSRLLQGFTQFYLDGTLPIPSLPDVAIRLREAINKEVGTAEAADIIEMDPIMTAKLVKIANSPLYATSVPVASCTDAISRLGLAATQSLVTSFSLKQLFICDKPVINRTMQKFWQQSLYQGALCHILAKENSYKDPEEALLAGLIANIGIVPFLIYAQSFPENHYNEQELTRCANLVAGPVGNTLLDRWDFSPELAEIPLLSNNWFFSPEGPLSLAEIVIVSKLHMRIISGKREDNPPLTAIPACRKLKTETLSKDFSLEVLKEAHDRIEKAIKEF